MKVTDDQSWEAVEYEYMMYFRSKARKGECLTDLVFHNAMVESQLVHARMLADFLITEQKKPFQQDDVTLMDLLPAVRGEIEGDIETFAGEYDKQLVKETLRWQINKLIVHLTHHRAGSGNHDALFAELERVLEPVLRLVAEKSQRQALIKWSAPTAASLSSDPRTNSTSGTGLGSSAVIPLGGQK